MSGKAGPTSPLDPEGASHQHGNALVEGATTALSWMTILPVKGAQVFDRTTGRRAIAALPVAGLVPGLAAALIASMWMVWRLLASSHNGHTALEDVQYPGIAVQAFVVGAIILVASEVLTRAMHVDGLADIADALGSYRDIEGAQKILRDPATGPMGVGAVGLYFAVMAAGLSAAVYGLYDAVSAAIVAPSGVGSGDSFRANGVCGIVFTCGPVGAWLTGLGALILPFLVGRAAATTACHKSFPPMSSTGFGSLVAGTQPTAVVLMWWVLLLLGGVMAGGLSGVLACIASAIFSVIMSRHCVRRLGGINGDVLGSIVQISTAICICFLAF